MKTCTTCGLTHHHDQCPRCHPPVSVGDDSLDAMVQAASTPNLASLFRRAKDAGVITGTLSNYGEGAPQGATAP